MNKEQKTLFYQSADGHIFPANEVKATKLSPTGYLLVGWKIPVTPVRMTQQERIDANDVADKKVGVDQLIRGVKN